MILLNFQIFTLVRKKHSTIFLHADLMFSIKTPLPSWYFILSSILLFNVIFILTFNKQHKFICRLLKYSCPKCLWSICTNNYINIETKPSLPSWMAITLPISHLFLLVSSRNKTMSTSFSQFCSIYDELVRLLKLPSSTCSKIHLLSIAHVSTVSYNICLFLELSWGWHKNPWFHCQ